MRHLLITLPVAILMSVVACGGDEGLEPGRNEGLRDDQAAQTEGRVIDREALTQALQADDREGFVREANQALDKAEREIRGTTATDAEKPENDKLREEIRADIRVARDDLDRLGGMSAGQWKDQGKEVDQKVQEIDRKLGQLSG